MKTNWFIVLVALFAVCCSSDGSSSENPFAMGNEDGGEACKEKASDCSSSSDSVKHKDESSDSKESHGPGPVLDEPVVEDTTVVSTADELPECSTANEGEAFAVGTEKSLYFCVNGTWVDDAIEKFGVTCSNGVLKLNAKAEPQAFDFDEAPSAYRRTQMNLVGRAEKGPFMYGSTVKVIELDSAMRLADSKRSFEACITSTDASYAFENLDLVSPYVRVEVNGYYRNELTGGLSSTMVTLKALTDLNSRDTVNVNILTHMASSRVQKLVEDSGNNQPIGSMGSRALNDVLSAFGISIGGSSNGGNNNYGGWNFGGNNGGFGGWNFGGQQNQNQNTQTGSSGKYAEDLSIFGEDDYNAALLAISIMMQSFGSDMFSMMDRISEDIKGDGNWGDNNDKAKLADKLLALDTSGAYETIRKNMASWNLGELPNFEKYLRSFWANTLGFETCNDYTAGQVKHVGNSMSSFFVSYYEQPEGPRVRFVCDKELKAWRVATDIEKDTVGFGAGEYDGQIRSGKINADKSYIYDQGKRSWRAATSDDIMEFEPIEKVYEGLASGDKVIFILRHAERGDDTGKSGHLTSNGKSQSQKVGEKFKGEDISFMQSTYTRSFETCENFAIGAGLSGVKPDTMEVLDGEWYVKDNAKLENYRNSDGGGWVVISAYAYQGRYSDAFYDLDEYSEKFITEVVKPAFAKANRMSVWISHDTFVEPFTVYVSDKKVNLRYFDTKRWINYLAGVAVIMDAKGSIRMVPVKGLDNGSMTM